MNIIPVIDYMRGQVVLAEKGNRASYQPVYSELCKHSDIHSVLRNLMSLADFNTVYVADLDSIENQQLNYSLWQEIFDAYANIQFWCDFGRPVSSWNDTMANVLNARPIVGTEAFNNIQNLTDTLNNLKKFRPLLSLDFKNSKLLGPDKLLSTFTRWPKDVIILSLNRVGSASGPDIELIQALLKHFTDCNVYVGGGIKNADDLKKLQSSGISGTLLAKSLHTKSISAQEITHFID